MLPGRIDWFSSPSASAAEETPRSARPTVIAIGKFDGIHRGHQALLSRVVVEARHRGMMAGVVTFDAHPRQVLFGERHDAISSLTDRRGLLRDIGLDFQFQLHACAPLFALEAEDFARQLIDALQCRVIFMGSDFRFGRRAAGDKATFARLGVAAVPVDPIVTTGSKVSSTRVRDVLRAGEIEL